MTLAEMTTQGQDLLNQTQGSDAERFGPFMWKRNLKNAADQFARSTLALYRTYSMDLVAGQSDYCAPPLIHITAGSVLGGDGSPRVLLPVGNQRYAPRDAGGWAGSGDPQAFAALGGNTVRLYDAPGYGTTGHIAAVPPAVQGRYGLVLEGPGTCADLWDAPGDVCPLPSRAHIGVVYLAASLCAAQMEKYQASANYQEMARYESGLLEAEVATMTAPQSGRSGGPGSLSLAVLAASGGTLASEVIDGGYLG